MIMHDIDSIRGMIVFPSFHCPLPSCATKGMTLTPEEAIALFVQVVTKRRISKTRHPLRTAIQKTNSPSLSVAGTTNQEFTKNLEKAASLG